MATESNTTVSVDRETTFRRLKRRRANLASENLEPGERVTMDDVVRDALDDRERLREAEERIEELEGILSDLDAGEETEAAA